MPKITITSEKIQNDINSGKIKEKDTIKVTFSIRYKEYVEILKFREETGESLSSIVRESVRKIIKDYHKETKPESQKLIEEIKIGIKEREREFMEDIKYAIKKEGMGESSESIKKYNSQIISLLKDLGPLKSNKLAKYLGVDWRIVQKICVELKEVISENGKWRLSQ